ncbi:hypothetical protein EVG20_g756 [Dentipellis fragilis]|uniref:Uncharacterized protein n=1 Tax=Dentipellis fragilis TaxID=205917 RepID=A0A4Y9ZEP9_9AGAM|nr:hypothetical protein EVG20_g756 [Dentipellis fragilis]
MSPRPLWCVITSSSSSVDRDTASPSNSPIYIQLTSFLPCMPVHDPGLRSTVPPKVASLTDPAAGTIRSYWLPCALADYACWYCTRTRTVGGVGGVLTRCSLHVAITRRREENEKCMFPVLPVALASTCKQQDSEPAVVLPRSKLSQPSLSGSVSLRIMLNHAAGQGSACRIVNCSDMRN